MGMSFGPCGQAIEVAIEHQLSHHRLLTLLRLRLIAWPSNAVYSLTRRSQRPLVAEFVQKSSGLFKKQQLTGLFCERDARNGCGRSKPRVLRPRLLHFDREERSLPCSPPWC
jgi:hypothetical protein